MSVETYLAEGKQLIDRVLVDHIPGEESYPESIHRSMHYSLLAGGKRLRPILTFAATEAVGGCRTDILPFAVAVELIHTYTLVHDDLPALDDDNFRRGRPTNHKVFGEDIAILTGDALLTHAFILMTDSAMRERIPSDRVLKAANEMARAMGSGGVIGGQVVDLESEGKPVEADTLEYIHIYKTGFFFKACVRCGAILGQADGEQLKAISRFGSHIGLAFQIVDDILDIVGDQKQLGKDVGSDMDREKATYPALYGLEESKRKAEELVEEAIATLEDFDERADPLRGIARFFIQRTY